MGCFTSLLLFYRGVRAWSLRAWSFLFQLGLSGRDAEVGWPATGGIEPPATHTCLHPESKEGIVGEGEFFSYKVQHFPSLTRDSSGIGPVGLDSKVKWD